MSWSCNAAWIRRKCDMLAKSIRNNTPMNWPRPPPPPPPLPPPLPPPRSPAWRWASGGGCLSCPFRTLFPVSRFRFPQFASQLVVTFTLRFSSVNRTKIAAEISGRGDRKWNRKHTLSYLKIRLLGYCRRATIIFFLNEAGS